VRRPLHELPSGSWHDCSHGSGPPGVHADICSKQPAPSNACREATCSTKNACRNRLSAGTERLAALPRANAHGQMRRRGQMPMVKCAAVGQCPTAADGRVPAKASTDEAEPDEVIPQKPGTNQPLALPSSRFGRSCGRLWSRESPWARTLAIRRRSTNTPNLYGLSCGTVLARRTLPCEPTMRREPRREPMKPAVHDMVARQWHRRRPASLLRHPASGAVRQIRVTP
jgi:hypothetical protein